MKVFVRDLKINMLIGIYPHEQKTLQEVIVNIEALVADPANWQRDDMADWVSYEDFVKAVMGIIETGHINLLETFAHRIADDILLNPRILSVAIKLEKTAAISGTRSVGVEYAQQR